MRVASLVAGLVLIAGVGSLVWYQNSARTSASATAGTGQRMASSSEAYGIGEVAAHNDTASCWTVIDGLVYDLTEWIALHPGGAAAIQMLCGIDGSEAFRTQHGHAAKQGGILATYQIGTLVQ